MKVLADISIIPIGVGVSLSKYVAACERELKNAGLQPKLHAFGTNVEGDWDAVMGVIKKCHDEVMKDSERVLISIKIDDRKSGEQRIEKKLESMEEKLGMKLKK